MNDDDTILKNIIRYSSSKLFTRVIRLLNAFIKPKLLTPDLFGLWNLLHIIENYVSYAHIGSTTSMGYLVPYHNGKKEISRSNEIKASAYFGTLYIYLLLAIVAVTIGLYRNDFDLKVRVGIFTVAALIVMEWYFEYYITLLRADGKFKFLSSLNYLKPSLAVILSVILIYFFSIYGLYVSALLSNLVVICYMKKRIKNEAHARFKFKIFSGLVKMGFPIMLFGFTILLLKTCDRVVVSYFLGLDQLGYYGIAVMATTFIRQVPESAREIIEIKMMGDLHNLSTEELLREYFFKPLVNTAYYYPFLIAVVFFISPPLIYLILPKYASGILATQIILLGGYFLALAFLTRGIIVANKWQFASLLIFVPVIILSIIISIIFIKTGMGINGVALSSSISNVILFILLVRFIRIKYNITAAEWAVYYKNLYLPFIIFPATILALQYVLNIIQLNRFLSGAIGLSISIIVMIIVINYSHRKYKLVAPFNLNDLRQNLIN